MKQKRYVLVYGSLKEGFSNHRLLTSSKRLPSGKIKGWAMFSLGSFPAIVPTAKRSSTIEVELYEVDNLTLVNLDRLEGFRKNPQDKKDSMYMRSKVQAFGHSCWIYHMGHRKEKLVVSTYPIVSDGVWKKPAI